MAIDLSEMRAKAQTLVNGFQVEGDIALAAMLSTQTKIPGGPSAQIRAIDQMLYHRVNHADATTEFIFFNENITPGIINFSNGQIPAQQVFALRHIGVEFVTGYTRTGTVGSAGALFSGTAVAPLVAAEAKRNIMTLGRFILTQGNETIFECVGLDKLPMGAGLDAAVAVAVTTGAVGYTCNGAPFAGNRRLFGDSPHLLPGGSTIAAKIILPAAVALAANTNGFFEVCLFGTTFRK